MLGEPTQVLHTRTEPSMEPVTISCAESVSELTESDPAASVCMGCTLRDRRSQQRTVLS
jgi:hypothetical protein